MHEIGKSERSFRSRDGDNRTKPNSGKIFSRHDEARMIIVFFRIKILPKEWQWKRGTDVSMRIHSLPRERIEEKRGWGKCNQRSQGS